MTASLTRRAAMQGGVLVVAAAGRARAATTELVVALHGLPESLETGGSSFANSNCAMQVLDALVLRDDAGQLLPGLATKWTALDPTSWKFDLRPGVTFHDGSAFSSADVKFTLDYVLAPQSIYGLKSRISLITAVEAPDAQTVVLRTKGPFPTLVEALVDIAIEPQAYVARVGRAGMTAHPVGTGPFRFRKWVPGDSYALDAFDGYWGGAPAMRSVLFRNIPEASTRAA
jgi:peptide/nickel transport system substrate-binding protein